MHMPPELIARLTKSAIDIRGVWSALLSPCCDLQDLELVVTSSGNREAEIISSINSASIRKVTLVCWWSIPSLSWRTVNWGAFNEPLCRLVNRLGPTRELAVEILIVDAGGTSRYGDIDPDTIVSPLVAFREKGRIRLAYVGRDGRKYIVYPLDPCCPNPPVSVCRIK